MAVTEWINLFCFCVCIVVCWSWIEMWLVGLRGEYGELGNREWRRKLDQNILQQHQDVVSHKHRGERKHPRNYIVSLFSLVIDLMRTKCLIIWGTLSTPESESPRLLWCSPCRKLVQVMRGMEWWNWYTVVRRVVIMSWCHFPTYLPFRRVWIQVRWVWCLRDKSKPKPNSNRMPMRINPILWKVDPRDVMAREESHKILFWNILQTTGAQNDAPSKKSTTPRCHPCQLHGIHIPGSGGLWPGLFVAHSLQEFDLWQLARRSNGRLRRIYGRLPWALGQKGKKEVQCRRSRSVEYESEATAKYGGK